MRYVGMTLVLICTLLSLEAQVLDIEFEWYEIRECENHIEGKTVYAKAENDPMVVSMSEQEFLVGLNSAVDKVDGSVVLSGTIKFKLYFGANGSDCCLLAIGTNGLSLSERETASFSEHFPVPVSYQPGQLRDNAVSCIGIVFITLEHGDITMSRIANFEFD